MKAFKILLVLSALVMASCFDDPGTDIVWGSEAYVELDRAGQPNPNVTISNPRLNDGTTYIFNVQINLMGRPRKSDTNITYEIDAASTAIEGVHYNKVVAGNTVTIPAGANTVNLQFEEIADNIAADLPGAADDKLIILRLTDADVELSKYVQVTYKLTVTCPSNLAMTYDRHTDWIDYYGDPGSNDDVATLTVAAGTARYNIADLSGGMEPIVWGTPPVPVVIQDACGTITLVSYSYAYAYFIDQPSTVSSGVITIDWRNVFGENGVSTYTPQ